jgi:hypothetical protein
VNFSCLITSPIIRKTRIRWFDGSRKEFIMQSAAGPIRFCGSFAWILETLSCIFGLCLLAGQLPNSQIHTCQYLSKANSTIVIVALLRSYDEKPQPELPLSLTLNALLQLLITLAQFSFTMPLVQSMSQLKWLWFVSEPRQLLTFQAYDDACRGGVGSAKLLFRVRDSRILRQ